LLEIQDTSNNVVAWILSDARRFILKVENIVDMALLQLYSSGLILTPQKALIRENFEKNPPDWLSKSPKVEGNWSPELQTLEGHSDSVWTVAFSQDGQLLASGSRDRTIKLWDPITGAVKHTLEGHSDWLRAVAFSQDGQFLASGSQDKTIKLWDPITGNLKHTLEGHSDWVQSVAFSQDSSGIPRLVPSNVL
jgi:WD40 repeat protein